MTPSGRSDGVGEGAAGDWSPDFGALGGWWGAEVLVLERVGIALEAKDLGVVDEPVDHRGGDDVVAEDLAPAAERLVAGDDQARAFVAARDEHEHQIRGLRVERDVADLVDDQQRDPLQASEFVVEAALALRVGEERDPFGRGPERDAMAGQASADPESDAQVGLAGAGRAQQDHVLLAGQEVELPEVQHAVAADRRLEAEVELLQGLSGREAGRLDAALAAVAVAAVDLGLEQRGGELLKAPLLLAGAAGELGQRPRGGRRLERPEQVRELRARSGHAINRRS